MKENVSSSKENSPFIHSENNQELSSVIQDNRPQTGSLLQMKEMMQNSPRTVAQREAFADAFGAGTSLPSSPNETGMPDNLKAGLENLSGIDLSDVKVHYNSEEPARLQAHAYAQGNQIYLAPGQEKHLPHEGWHVVQQKQGRVQPTQQLKGKLSMNDDDKLEKEADVMGSKALQLKADHAEELSSKGVLSLNTIQRKPSKVKTNSGVFEAIQYEAFTTKASDDHIGAIISLTFTPEPPVVGRIGLIQTIKRSEKHSMAIDTPIKMHAKLAANEDMRLFAVGQSPVYGALRDPDKAAEDDNKDLTLADTTDPKVVLNKWTTSAHVLKDESAEDRLKRKGTDYASVSGNKNLKAMVSSQTGQIGGNANNQAVIPASLNDQPGFAANTINAREARQWSAETAAVVLDGPMEGTYLGSIRWGWNYTPDKDGNPVSATLLGNGEIELVSAGIPSHEFITAGQDWNAQKPQTDEQGTFKLIPVPIPKRTIPLKYVNQTIQDISWESLLDYIQDYLMLLFDQDKTASQDKNLRFQASMILDELNKRLVDRGANIHSFRKEIACLESLSGRTST